VHQPADHQRTFGAKNLQEGQKGVLICGALKLLGPLYLVLPAPLTGLFAAVLVGAILSSYNSALNSTTTLFSFGIYKPTINREASEEKVVKSGKIFGLFIAIVSMIGAPMLIGQASIFGYLQKMNGLYFITIFAVVVVGIVLGYFVFTDVVNAMHEFHFLGAVFTMLLRIMLLIGFRQPLA